MCVTWRFFALFASGLGRTIEQGLPLSSCLPAESLVLLMELIPLPAMETSSLTLPGQVLLLLHV